MKGDFYVVRMSICLIIGLAFSSCTEEAEVTKSPLIGKWVSPYNDATLWEFQTEKHVKYLRDGQERPGNIEMMISRGGIEYKSTAFGPLNYRYKRLRDRIKFETYGSLNDSKSDTVTFKSIDYSLSAFSHGFNQYGRTDLDYEFGEYLSGQVASFSIGYLQDQYVYKEYMKKITSKGEEIKG